MLKLAPDYVRGIRRSWNEDQVMHAVFDVQFKRGIEECRTAMESAPIEKVPELQATIRALRSALAFTNGIQK